MPDVKYYSSASGLVRVDGLGIGGNPIANVLVFGGDTRMSRLSAGNIQWGNLSTYVGYLGISGSNALTQLNSAGAHSWSSGAIGGASDTSVSRTGAAVVQAGDGGANANGKFNAAGFQAGGTDGVAGPTTLTTITSITVKGGIVTAIAGS